MDKDIMKYGTLTVEHYNRGLRANREPPHPGIGGMFFQKSDGSKRYTTDRESILEWDSLRAYQDEQRKKGDVISWDGNAAEFATINGWLKRDFHADGLLYKYCVQPYVDDLRRPAIWVHKYPGDPVACFTNFRWKPGYPKRTPYSGLEGVKANSIVNRYPKGGRQL